MATGGHLPMEWQSVIHWLLQASEPWVVYNTLRDLVTLDVSSPNIQQAYQGMQQHPAVLDLFHTLQQWPAVSPLGRAYDPKDSIWKVATLADLGFDRDDERIARLAEQIFVAQAEDGGFLHGGFDHTKSWDTRPYECLTHVMTYALARFGYGDDPRLERAYHQLTTWQRLDGGWHPNTQMLPGQPKETELSCPFGTVNVLRAVGMHPVLRMSDVATRGADYLLSCWVRRAEPSRPVGFGIGSTWDKLQYPLVQYQLLKVIDTLSLLPATRADARYLEIVDRLKSKRDPEGHWKAEGVNKPWSAFDFGQKKAASPWITFLAVRVCVRTQGLLS
jgi:hypothetical protein